PGPPRSRAALAGASLFPELLGGSESLGGLELLGGLAARGGLLPAESRPAVLEHRADALARVGAGARAARDLVQVLVLEALAQREGAADDRLHAGQRERGVAGDRSRQIGGGLLQLRGGNDRRDHPHLLRAPRAAPRRCQVGLPP